MKEELIEMIATIESEEMLIFIYNFTKGFIKKYSPQKIKPDKKS